jgi:hypothetical protein
MSCYHGCLVIFRENNEPREQRELSNHAACQQGKTRGAIDFA